MSFGEGWHGGDPRGARHVCQTVSRASFVGSTVMSTLLLGWMALIGFLAAVWLLAAFLDRVWPANIERQQRYQKKIPHSPG